MFPAINSEHLERASKLASRLQGADWLLLKMKEEAPALARAAYTWTDITAVEYTSFPRGFTAFRLHMAWVIGALYAAYGRFPHIADDDWVERRYREYLLKRRAKTDKEIFHALHEELEELNAEWMVVFYELCMCHNFNEDGIGRVYLLADMFLCAVRDEQAKEQLEIDKRSASAFVEFVEGNKNFDYV